MREHVVDTEKLRRLTEVLSSAPSFTGVVSEWVGDELELELRLSDLVARELPDPSAVAALALFDERLLSRRAFLRSRRWAMPVAEVFATVALDRIVPEAASELLSQLSARPRLAVSPPQVPLGALLLRYYPEKGELTRANTVAVTSRRDEAGEWQCLRVSGVLSVADVPVATTTEYVYSAVVDHAS